MAVAYAFPTPVQVEYPPKQCASFVLQHSAALPRSFGVRPPSDRVLRSARAATEVQVDGVMATAAQRNQALTVAPSSIGAYDIAGAAGNPRRGEPTQCSSHHHRAACHSHA